MHFDSITILSASLGTASLLVAGGAGYFCYSVRRRLKAVEHAAAPVQTNILAPPAETPALAASASAFGGYTSAGVPAIGSGANAPPMNLNRRGQMLRMHRRGESIAAIAAALGISQGEVKLTVRMQELFSEIPEKEISL